jgi:hypothetical protein
MIEDLFLMLVGINAGVALMCVTKFRAEFFAMLRGKK